MRDERCGGFSLHLKSYAAPTEPAHCHCIQEVAQLYNLICLCLLPTPQWCT